MTKGLGKYLLILSGTTLTLLAAVIAFNALIDPLGMYVSGVNKPAMYHRVRLLKAYESRRVKPEPIVLVVE